MIAQLFPMLALINRASYRLFLDPLPIGEPWAWPWLVVPLCLGVSVVYKSIRCKSMKTVPREAGVLAVTIILCMAAGALALAVLVRGLEAMHR